MVNWILDPAAYIFAALLVIGAVGVVLWLRQDNAKDNAGYSVDAAAQPQASSRDFVTLTQSISFGVDTVPAGTRLELVSKEDSEVHIRYKNVVYGIPISATDRK